MEQKPPTSVVDTANRAHRSSLPLRDTGDFTDADRGFIAAMEPCGVTAADGRVVWDNDVYSFLAGDAPSSVHPSLWRQSQLCAKQGLYEVVEGIDLDSGGPAPHAVSPTDLLLGILYYRIRQTETLANDIHCLGIGATVERDDEGRSAVFIAEPLQALQLREARRRPRLPEVQENVMTLEPVQCETASTIGERSVWRSVAR